ESSPIEPARLVVSPGSGLLAVLSGLWTTHRKVIWGTAGVILVALLGYTVHSLAIPPRIQFTGVVQLTNDGAFKEGLVTDGRTIYFGEHQDSRIVLVSVSTAGGPVRTISSPFVKATPTDISRDGKKLLVVVREGIEEERALWIVPIAGG